MKGKDLKIDLKHILYVESKDCNFGFEIPQNQSWFTDEDWKKNYPDAYAIYKIYGQSPSLYVTKTKIK